ncbi:MAG: SDR family NAD(P)-dependent oxidoreductase [Acidobacteriota bacterium]
MLTGVSSQALAERCAIIADESKLSGFLRWLATASQLGMAADETHRLAIVASDEDDLRNKLRQAGERLRAKPDETFSAPTGIYYGHGEAKPRVALLFPGQGSQYLGMGGDLAIGFERAREIWDMASSMSLNGGSPLQSVVFPQPVFNEAEREEQSKRLTATEWAQPAIGATSLGQLALLRELGIEADCVGGHSYGEITALCAAGVLDAESMLRVARRRGELMRDAAAVPGGMTAVSTSIEHLEALLAEWCCDVTVANHNSPQQVVLSGSVEAIEDVERRLGDAKIKARRVPVATAFHSSLVSPSSEPFLEFLETLELASPRVDVYSNAEAAPYPTEPAAIRRRLAEQIAKPVRFVDQIQAMAERGVDTFIEVGPGSVLTNLVRKCLASQPHLAISLDRKGRHGATSLWHALGQLTAAGLPIDFAPLWQDVRPTMDPRQAPKPKMALPITGTNYGKVYPPAGGTAVLPKPNPPQLAPAPETRPARTSDVPKANGAEPSTEAAQVAEAEPAPLAAAAAAPISQPESQAASIMSTPPDKPPTAPAADLPTATSPSASTNSETELAWLRAYQEAQRQTADAHAAYQASMAEAQASFLQTMEASFTGLNSLLLGQPVPASVPAARVTALQSATAPANLAAPVVTSPPTAVAATPPAAVQPLAAVPAAPAPAISPDAEPTQLETPEPSVTPEPIVTPEPVETETVEAAVPEPAPAPALQPAAAIAAAEGASVALDADLQALMLKVVADKTGYPVEMLQLDMDMEADLGIDSIKRVEILSAMREEEPALPEVDTAKMAQLRTLQEIVDFMGVDASSSTGAATQAAPESTIAPASTPPAPTASPAVAATGPKAEELQSLMLEVVADKTGYPAEMLQLDMDMEADLGIDSIKRVEILSAMREAEPALPEVDTAKMAQLRTLQEIVDFMRTDDGMAAEAMASDPLPAEAAVVPDEAQAAVAAAVAAPTGDPSPAKLQGLMLEVVADKTGYPADMLQLDMDMEADLGIDSIKRVEILSAMREAEPALPEVDTARMAQLRTLQEIVDFMQGDVATASVSVNGGAPSQAPVTDPNAETQPMAAIKADESGLDPEKLQALMLDVVADKTGYPADMLNLDMDMEADLGIDSIKRVEILSAMREQQPDLPEVDTARMAELRTLGQIVDFMRADEAATPAAETPIAETSIAETSIPETLPLATSATSGAEASPDAERDVESLEAPELTPSASTPPAVDVSEAELGRFALRVVDAPANGLAMAGLASSSSIVITDEGTGIAEAVVGRLVQRGLNARVVESVPADATAVLFLGGLRPLTSLEEGLTVNRQAFRAARAVASNFTEAERGVFVTVQDTGGDFGLSGRDLARATLGGLAGLTKTAAHEWPGCAVKAIDLERGGRAVGELADALVAELLEGGAEIEIGLRADGRRTTLESYMAPLGPERISSIGPESVILASGGARGVTAATLIALARQAQPRLVLLGRTPLEDEPEACRGVEDDAALKRALLDQATAAGEKLTPKQLGARAHRIRAGREIRTTLEALEEAGSQARYLTADVRDVSTLAAALDTVRRDWGAITGIIHGAGVIADKAIAEKTQDQYDRVFDTKVDGLMRLLEATFGDPIDLLCLFSSVTARCGNTGQSDYAMANEVLNKIAAAESRRRGPGCRVKSLNWGPWEGGMVTPELEGRFAELGVKLIPLATGAQMMVDELTAAGETADDIEVVLGGAPALGPLGAVSNDNLAMDAFVSRQTHAFLDSHKVGGTAVLPVVLALEWFTRLARAHRPDLDVVACRDLKVLSGIRLERFADGVEGFHLHSRQLTNGTGCELALELRDRDGRPRYRALIDMAAPGERTRPAAETLPELEPWTSEVYGGALFHGPELQVIRSVEGVSSQHIAGRLIGGGELGWGAGWSLDAALLDGGLQLAVLWFDQALQGASLPLAIGSLHHYHEGPLSGSVSAIAHCQERDNNRAVADIVFSTENGVVAELRAVELVRRPDEDAMTPRAAELRSDLAVETLDAH